MRLDRLRQVGYAPQLRGGIGDFDGHDGFAGLCRGQQVAYRANAANARHQGRHLIKRTALVKLLETAYLGYGEEGLLDIALVIGLQRYLAMTFKACHRINHNGLRHSFSYAPKRVRLAMSGVRPASKSVRTV
jgi:hypothetical protein